MKDLLTYLVCGAVTGAAVFALPSPEKPNACRCDCYYRGKEDGRKEVRKADAERRAARSRGDELPEFMDREGWSPNMPDVN